MKVISRSILALFLSTASAMAAPADPKPPVPGAVRMQVHNAQFHVMEGVVLSVARLDAWMIPRPGQTVSLDNKTSFTLQIRSGETHLRAEDLTTLTNYYLLPHAKTPIKNLTIRFDGGTVAVKGIVHKGVDVPFEGKGTLSLASDSAIRLRFTDLKVAGVVKKGFLDFLGIKLSQVAQPEKESRFYIEGDDIILPIAALFPPPRVAGKLTSVRIDGNEMVQVFGPANSPPPAAPDGAKNYIYFRGGRMKFGKLTMEDVDLELVDKDPSNAFDFSLDHYQQQLAAGYSKSLLSLGLVVYMPDYAAISKKN
ncbi:MAG: hypothetical protein WAK33_14130 [Silvibacterium sp.]